MTSNLFQTLYGLPAAGGVFVAYLIPGYLLAGLHFSSDLIVFHNYIGTSIKDN